MNKAILLCAAGMLALSVTGCNTCCETPCCPPQAAAGYGYGMDYAPVQYSEPPVVRHKKVHQKKVYHKPRVHKKKPRRECVEWRTKPVPAK